MYEVLLIATDGSDVASSAAEQGLAIAEALDARVRAVSVADVPEGATAGERLLADCRRNVEAVAAGAADRGVEVSTDVREGRPHREILTAADGADADVVVLGTHGRTGVRRLLLGSVATAVVREARRPVLTVAPSAEGVPREVERILVATDGRAGAVAAVGHAGDLAAAFGAELRALSVVDDVHSRLPVVLEAMEETAEAAVRDAVERARDRDVDADRTVERGRPAEVVVDRAADWGADLVVVGTESRSSVERVAMGSVSQRVVGSSPAPVVTVRATD